MNSPLAERLGAALATIATPIAIVAVAVIVFLNPIWVGFEQRRSEVARLTGYSASEVDRVTGSILSDLVFGPPSFDVAVNGSPVLDARSRAHMVDVRRVFFDLGGLALVAILALAVVALAARGAAWFWRGVRLGAAGLAVGVVVLGVAFGLFFDQMFELFHQLFFPPGTYDFDPRTERLVQLFPDQFWSETTMALAVVVLGLAVVVWLLARTRGGRAPAASRAMEVAA